jgi:hypothetical protein
MYDLDLMRLCSFIASHLLDGHSLLIPIMWRTRLCIWIIHIFKPWLILLIPMVYICIINVEYYIFHHLVYFDRYHKTKLLQFQAADDEFFLPDSEVIYFKYLQ